jgi:carboxyl-terminal processing protease
MLRRPALLALLFVGACSAKAPGPTADPRTHRDARDAAVSAEVPPPDPREEALGAAVTAFLERQHLLRPTINDALSRTAYETYVTQLDAGKMFLLKADVDKLAPFADKIDDELRSGRLDLAHAGAEVYAARVVVVDKLVAELLAAPFDLTNDESFELDAKKVAWATSEAELRDRWRRRLELEVLERTSAMEARLAVPTPTPGAGSASASEEDDEDEADVHLPADQIPKTPEAREAKARADLTVTYAGRFARLRTPLTLKAAAELVNAVTSSIDPHTTYLPPADKANFDIAMSGSLEGIGAVLRERDHYIEVSELVPGGASWRQGDLEPGDLILSVTSGGKAAVDTVDMRIDDVVKMVRGPKGTVVRLAVQKPSGEKKSISITRDVIVIESSYARGAILQPVKGGPSYGYIYLPSFYGGNEDGQRTSAGDVRKLLAELASKRVAGVILDIRGNGGGYLTDSVDMSGLFVDRGPIVQVQDGGGRREVLSDDDRGTQYDGQVIVMVDHFSASASEILAGALQDYHRALIVGTSATHGKGTVQSLVDLDRAAAEGVELGVLKLTIQQFFRVSGASTQLEGVTPDVLLPDPTGFVEAGERSLEHAIPWSKIDAAKHDDWKPAWTVEALVAKSALRVAKQPVFAKIVARSKLLEARQKDTVVPLARAAYDARRKEQKAALEAVSPDLDKGPARFAVTSVGEQPAPLPPGPGGKVDDRVSKWREGISRDPWIAESLSILADMTAASHK